MTYSEITDLIDTNLASLSRIPANKHREVEFALLDYIEAVKAFIPINRGFITGVDVGSGTPGTFETVGGDIASAERIDTSNGFQQLKVTLTNAMPSVNYVVKCSIQSLGTLADDWNVSPWIFAVISTTQFTFLIRENSNSANNLKIHLETISLD